MTDDSIIRQRLARAHTKVEIMRYFGYQALTNFLHGKQPGPDASIGKLFWSEYHQAVTELSVDILGADTMVPTGQAPQTAFRTDQPGSPNDTANWVGVFYNARAGTIYAGTSQVQKGIVASRSWACRRSLGSTAARGTPSPATAEWSRRTGRSCRPHATA